MYTKERETRRLRRLRRRRPEDGGRSSAGISLRSKRLRSSAGVSSSTSPQHRRLLLAVVAHLLAERGIELLRGQHLANAAEELVLVAPVHLPQVPLPRLVQRLVQIADALGRARGLAPEPPPE